MRNNNSEEDIMTMVGLALQRKKKQHAGKILSFHMIRISRVWHSEEKEETNQAWKIIFPLFLRNAESSTDAKSANDSYWRVKKIIVICMYCQSAELGLRCRIIDNVV